MQPSHTKNFSEILITPVLATRKTRRPCESKAKVFGELTVDTEHQDDSIFQTICNYALQLCNASAAGISQLKFINDQQSLNMIATSGNSKKLKCMTYPRDHSPCGATLDLYSYQLFTHPERYYGWMQEHRLVVPETLVMPIYKPDHTPFGTFWVNHEQDKKFDREDLSIMSMLASFITAYIKRLEVRPVI